MIILVEPSKTVVDSGFLDELREALVRNQGDLQNARIGLALLSDNKTAIDIIKAPELPKRTKPGQNATHEALAEDLGNRIGKHIERLKAMPEDLPRAFDIHAAMRSAALAFPRGRNLRRLLVIAFDSAEAESDIEGTATTLIEQGVVADFLTVEATLSDSYWNFKEIKSFLVINYERRILASQSVSMVGGDGPLQDMPSGFLFQLQEPTCITPSGYAPYALSRIAFMTKGRTFLYSAKNASSHRCDYLSFACIDCAWQPISEHIHKENYTMNQLQALAPSVVSRSEHQEMLSRDPYARAVRKAWREAYAASLIASKPGGGGSRQPLRIQLEDPDQEIHMPILAQMLEDCRRIAAELETSISRPSLLGNSRQRAIAHYTLAMLRVNEIGLLKLQAFSATIPAKLKEHEKNGPLSPIHGKGDWYDIDRKDRNLCHGLVGHLRREPEGAARAAMAQLAGFLPKFEALAEHSPIWWAFHRASIPEFDLVVVRQRPDAATQRQPRPESQPDLPSTPSTPRPTSPTPTGPTTGGGI